jgi:hypothetical protein
MDTVPGLRNRKRVSEGWIQFNPRTEEQEERKRKTQLNPRTEEQEDRREEPRKVTV